MKENLLEIQYLDKNSFQTYLNSLSLKVDLNSKLKIIKELIEFNHISDIISNERLQLLESIADKINARNLKEIKYLIFICTHNSRRSHLCDVWFAIGLEIFGKSNNTINYNSFSGGTEVVRVHQNIINTLLNTGFEILVTNDDKNNGTNNIFELRFNQIEKQLYSKVYFDKSNPQKDFFAIMVCSDADTNCPIVSNSIDRFYLPFEDPKFADIFEDYDKCLDIYKQTSFLIALEMFFLVSKLK